MSATESVAALKPTRPVLRYHGGKWRLAKWIASHFPRHRTYTEVYGGAASVLLHKPRSFAEIYNDLDGEVCHVFRVLRNPSQARELKRVLELTPFARAEFDLSYLPGPADDPVELARRTIIRSFMGFASAAASGQATGFRYNVSRPRSLPVHNWVNYPVALDFFVERLRGIIIENHPAVSIIKRVDGPETLHYVDPPYVSVTRSAKNRRSPFYRFEMSDQDHAELATALKTCKGMVVLSGYKSGLYEELYGDWTQLERPAQSDGGRRIETLWVNPRVSAALKQGFRQRRPGVDNGLEVENVSGNAVNSLEESYGAEGGHIGPLSIPPINRNSE